MNYVIELSASLRARLQRHLFQNRLEQGAFLFSRVEETASALTLRVEDVYLIPPEGWAVQHALYLEMTDAERAKIMQLARAGGYAVIDCHSHPGSAEAVKFSSSDHHGITEFAAYVQWKLNGKPYAAMVCSESSLDAVVWHRDFREAHDVHEVRITGGRAKVLIPRGTWAKAVQPNWSQ